MAPDERRHDGAATPGEEELRLFREAMQRLEAAPDKDRQAGGAVIRRAGLRRRRPPRAKGLVVDDSLDLHRTRVEDALGRLERFVLTAERRGRRTVVVITGKGHHSPSGESVIKSAVERWIQRRGKERIEAYSEAPARYGGGGAFVLWLRPR